MQDPWLQGNSTERNLGKPIDATVVQRIQVGRHHSLLLSMLAPFDVLLQLVLQPVLWARLFVVLPVMTGLATLDVSWWSLLAEICSDQCTEAHHL